LVADTVDERLDRIGCIEDAIDLDEDVLLVVYDVVGGIERAAH